MTSVAPPVPHDDIGTELVREWVPDSEPRATLVLVHGIAEHSGRYERTGGLLADAGFHVRAFDVIGHGASGGARVDIDDWSQAPPASGTVAYALHPRMFKGWDL